MAEPGVGAQARGPFDDRAEQYIGVQVALHDGGGLAGVDLFNGAGRGFGLVGGGHDRKAVGGYAQRGGGRVNPVGFADQNRGDQPRFDRFEHAGQRRRVVRTGDRGGQRRLVLTGRLEAVEVLKARL